MSLSWITLLLLSALAPQSTNPVYSTVEPAVAKSAPANSAVSPGQGKDFAIAAEVRRVPAQPPSQPLAGNVATPENVLPLAKVVAIIKPMAPPPSSAPAPLPVIAKAKDPEPKPQ
jgi:hypothetical protein